MRRGAHSGESGDFVPRLASSGVSLPAYPGNCDVNECSQTRMYAEFV